MGPMLAGVEAGNIKVHKYFRIMCTLSFLTFMDRWDENSNQESTHSTKGQKYFQGLGNINFKMNFLKEAKLLCIRRLLDILNMIM